MFGTVEECLKRFFPGHSTVQISHLLAALADACAGGFVSAQALTSTVGAMPWPPVSPPLATLLELIARESRDKYQECINATCSAISQKSISTADGESRLVDLVDIQASLNAQNISDPDGVFAHLQQYLCGLSTCDGARVPLQLPLDFVRMKASIRLPGWCDLRSGMDYCIEQGAKEVGSRSLGSLPEVE